MTPKYLTQLRKWSPQKRLGQATDEVLDHIDLRVILDNVEIDVEYMASVYNVPAHVLRQKVCTRLVEWLRAECNE